MQNTNSETKLSVYKIVTERIIEALKAGTVPWHQPWMSAPAPRNFLSGSPYRGVNALLLRMAEGATPFWLTRGQVELRGGTIKEGAHGQPITFWRAPAKLADDATQEEKDKARSVLRYYRVYNYADCTGLPPAPELTPNTVEPSTAADSLIAKMPQRPKITRNGDSAYYSITADTVNVPAMELFENPDAFYSTFFHELAHSTRHSTRLDRRYINEKPDSPRKFGSCDYSREELVAEITAAFLTAELGLTNNVQNSASYIAGWLEAFANDEKLIVHAAAAAQKAADFIAGRLQPKPAPQAAPATEAPAAAPAKKAGRKAKRITADMAA